MKTEQTSDRITFGAKRSTEYTRLASMLCMTSVVFLLGLAPLHSAMAQNPFDIDPTNPNLFAIDPSEQFADPSGSVQELGALNGKATKLGGVHTALPPMLDFTNPNGQTDLVKIWLATKTDAQGDTWLYFAWERDASSGSSVVTYEFQQAVLQIGCVYNPDETPPIDMVQPETLGETALIANCNPWGGRQEDDFLIVWDFKGGDTAIILRTFDGIEFDTATLDSVVSVAALNADTSMGEGAINLSQTVFLQQADQCFTVGNIITGTITGNSDNADYKDTLLADFGENFKISNCGTVIIKKITDPAGIDADFAFSHNLDLLPDDDSHTSFNLSDGETMKFENVVTPGQSYFVEEADPGAEYESPTIDCSNSDPTVSINQQNRKVSFDLDRGEKVECIFTNTRKPTLTINKVCNPAGDLGKFDLLIDDLGSSDTACGGSYGPVEVTIGSHTISESDGTDTDLDNYDSVISGACDADGSVSVAAGEDKVCTITNTRKPTLTINKVPDRATPLAVVSTARLKSPSASTLSVNPLSRPPIWTTTILSSAVPAMLMVA